MPAERYYHSELLEANQKIQIKDQEHHHLVNVMRARIGDEIEIINGKGQLAKAIVESLEKKSTTLFLKAVVTESPGSQRLILAQGMPRQNRLEFIIEKGTELGMTEIWLFPAAHSEKKELSTNQLERLQALTIAAIKQCGRLFLPKIVVMPPLKQWKNIGIDSLFFGDTHPEALPFLSVWQEQPEKNTAVFFIGPESGFSDNEIEILRHHHAKGVKLHPHILRTETAAITALSLLSHYFFYS